MERFGLEAPEEKVVSFNLVKATFRFQGLHDHPELSAVLIKIGMTPDLVIFLGEMVKIFYMIHPVFMLSRVVIQYFILQNVPKLSFVSRQGLNGFASLSLQ